MQMTDPASKPLLAHTGFVRELARRLVLDEADADDVAQQTWLAALRRPPDGSRDVRPWLATVVRNTAWSLFRGRRRQREREAAAARPEAVHDRRGRERLLRLVTGAVLSLDEPYRETVLLRFFEGLPPREIARQQSVPVETVRTRVRRALAQLRKKLDEAHEVHGAHGDSRPAWATLLLPLCRLPAPVAATTSAVVAPALLGAAAIALLGVVVWRGIGDRGERGDPDAHTPIPVTQAPDDDSEGAGAVPQRRPNALVITGRVLDERGRPLKDARVAVVFPDNSAPADATANSAGTDDNGGFSLRAPGTHAVRIAADAPGYATNVTGWLVLDGARANAGTVRLRKERIVAGRVVDMQGHAVAGAKVVIETERDPIPTVWLYPGLTRWMETDAAGEFMFDGLPPGPYRIIADFEEREAVLRRIGVGEEHELRVPDKRPVPIFRLHGTVRTPDGKRTDGEVSAGKTVFSFRNGRMDRKVRAAGAATVWIRVTGYAPFVFPRLADVTSPFEVVLAPPREIRGRVVSDVAVRRISAQWLLPRRVPPPPSHIFAADVAPDGSFVFRGLAPGQYRLGARRPAGPRRPNRLRTTRVIVAEAGTAGHVVELVRTVSTHIEIGVAGPPGTQPVQFHTALFDRRDGRWLWSATGNGAFDHSLRPGVPYRVVAWARAQGGRTLAPTLLDFTGGQKTVRVIAGIGRTATGRVVDESGQPVPGARVRAMPNLDRDRGQGYFDLHFRSGPFGYSDEQGRFSFAGVPERGQVRLHAATPGYSQVRVDSEAGKPPTIVMRRAHAVVGRIVDPAGGPTGLMRVALFAGSREVTAAWAGGSGFFRLYAPPGRYRLLVWEDGGPDDRCASVEVKAGDADIVVSLVPGRHLRGRVTDAVPGTQVVVGGPWGKRVERVDAAGWFYLRGVPRGIQRGSCTAYARTRTRRGRSTPIEDKAGPVTLLLEK